ncbi:MAG: hypothetical protein L6V93_15745 [Clostridiales bacterium]|nr:MAG: hypothetical protein L6V93_15745 [Clostridiales bacterium]
MGKEIREITFPPESILVLIIRDGKKLVPNGKKRCLKEGDSLILSGKASDGASDVHLYEITVEENDGFSGRALKDIAYDRKLIIMIRRRGKKSSFRKATP